jgi:hypothetical protein
LSEIEAFRSRDPSPLKYWHFLFASPGKKIKLAVVDHAGNRRRGPVINAAATAPGWPHVIEAV